MMLPRLDRRADRPFDFCRQRIDPRRHISGPLSTVPVQRGRHRSAQQVPNDKVEQKSRLIVDNSAVGSSAFAPVTTNAGLTVVVTGGAGFLGSHLCQRLIDQGHRVICVDNFHTGRKANVSALAASGRFELIEHDIVTPFDRKLPRFDHIYNLACPASPPYYQADAVQTA